VDLICPFDTDDPEFVRGFEVGTVWSQVRTGEPCVVTVHATNVEMVMRMAEATGRLFEAEDLDDDWIAVAFP